MASSNTAHMFSFTQAGVPIFDGEHYDFWSVHMRLVFQSQGLWHLIEKEAAKEPAETSKGKEPAAETLKAAQEEAMQEAKALLLLHQGVSKGIYPRIMGASTPKCAWDILHSEFQGSEKVIAIKLQHQWKMFENISMKENETIKEFVTRLMVIVNQIRSLGDKLKDKKIAPKILRCLPPKFNAIVTTIEETKDLKHLSISELMGSLQAHEERVKGSSGELEHVFQTKIKINKPERGPSRAPNLSTRGRGRGRQGETRVSEQHNNQTYCVLCKRTNHVAFDCFYKCKRCKKPTHMEKDCWSKDKKEEAKFLDTTEKLLISRTCIDNTWFIDSGCSNHMSPNEKIFINLVPAKKTHVILGDGKGLEIAGTGTVAVLSKDGQVNHIEGVHLVPKLSQSLLSVGQLMRSGYTITFDGEYCHIMHKETSVCMASISMTSNNMFPFIWNEQNDCALMGSTTLSLWHHRFAHLNNKDLQMLKQKEMVAGLPKLDGDAATCEGCIMGKIHRLPFPKSTNWRAKEPLELVHADLWGPATSPSLDGMRYYLCLTDDFSRYSWIYFLQQKSEAYTKFREFKALAEKESGHSLKCLRTDRGGEFTSQEFQDYCRSLGITRELTSPYSPEQNGVAERKNRTIMEKVKAMLQHHNLPQELWAEAAQTTVYVLNRSPTRSLEEVTPYEAWRKKKPNVQHLRTFGCLAYRHIPKEGRRKLEMKAEKGVFIGYSLESKAYRIYNPVTKKLSISRDVIFEEGASWDWDQNPEVLQPITEVAEFQPSNPVEARPQLLQPEPVELEPHEPASESEEEEVESSHPKFRSLADIYQQTEGDMALHTKEEPESYADAAADPRWRKAMREEIEMVEKNHTWELVPKPANKNVLNLKWVYKAKQNEEGEVIKYKARIVAKGYTQRQGIDFHETFAPVVRMESIRAFLAVAAQARLEVHQLDVKSAFLNGSIEEEVYVHQPEGFKKKGEEEKVYKLNKALYGLKQAPRAWNQKIDTYLTTNGYNRSQNDPALYIKRFTPSHFLILCLYVDDLIFIGSTQEIVKEFKQTMKKEYEMSDLGLMKFFLGFQINQKPRRIFINQKSYIEKVLEKYGMKECKPAQTPMATGTKLLKNGVFQPANEANYRSLIGSLIYITNTRPDVEYAVSILSRFLSKPSAEHLTAAKRVLRYLKGTLHYGLLYEEEASTDLTGFSDSDWGGDSEDRKSTSGYVFMLGSKAVTWSSRKQKSVALSTAEAEYVAVCSAACEAVWLNRLFKELLAKEEGKPIQIKCDNTAAIGIAKNPIFHNRTKHIELRYHFLKDLVEEKQVELSYCQSNKQLADIMTKPLPEQNFMEFRKLLVSALRGDDENINAEDKVSMKQNTKRSTEVEADGKEPEAEKLQQPELIHHQKPKSFSNIT
ncbi:hypothetical protein KSP39_PZI022778 [Platanthera zijinensis]|uniref:Integrase catalytic domain-containing protein n=1 Tax=Platanthera zijinensis TaxID=2320716 RepID=A0AAP0AW07_9ASPA